MKSAKLYELAGQSRVLDEWLDEAADEIAAAEGEVPAALAELMERLDGEFADKVEGIVRVLRNVEASAEIAKAEARRLSNRAKAFETRSEWLRRYLASCLAAAGRDTVKTAVATVTLRKPKPSFAIAAGLAFVDFASRFPGFARLERIVTEKEVQVFDEDAVAAALASDAPPEGLRESVTVTEKRTLSIR